MRPSRKIVALILALMPGRLQRLIRRRVFGQKIDPLAHIGFGTLIFSREICLDRGAKIGPFSFVNTHRLVMERGSRIQPLAILQCGTAHLKENSHIAFFAIVYSEILQGADFVLGVQSRIFPFCWIDPGEGIELGNQVGVGSYSMIYTHGVWANYLKGGPVKFAPVKVGDNTWLPARVFVMPGVTIGSNVIVGAGSVVTKDLASDSIYAGFPAKMIKEGWVENPDDSELAARIQRLAEEFQLYRTRRNRGFSLTVCLAPSNGESNIVFHREIPQTPPQGQLDICLADESYFLRNRQREELVDFISFLRRYGVRLNQRESQWP